MIPKLSFWQGLGCSVLVVIGQTVALAGGRPGGQHPGGNAQVRRAAPTQQAAAVRSHNIGTQTSKIQVMSGSQQNLAARKLPSGITLGTPVSGRLSGTLVKQSGAGTSARTKPSPINPGVAKPPIAGGPFPPIVGGGTSGGGTVPPSGGGSTPPAGGGTTPTTPPTVPPSGGGTTPPAGNHGHHHHHHPNWWLTAALYPRYGAFYGNYYSPICNPVVNVASAPVVLSPSIISIEESAVVAERLTLQLGESYSLKNENFGDAAGQIVLELNGLTLPALVTSWDAQTISFTLPTLGLNQSSNGVLRVVNSDQSVMKSINATIIAAAKE